MKGTHRTPAPRLMISLIALALISLGGSIGPELRASQEAPTAYTAGASRRAPDQSDPKSAPTADRAKGAGTAANRAERVGPPLRLIDEAGLRRSVVKMYEAYAAKDWKSVHGFMGPLMTDLTGTLEEFVADMKDENGTEGVKSWKILRVGTTDRGPTAGDKALLDGMKIESAAVVTMDVTYVEADGKEDRTTDQEDIWIRMNGRWFFMWQTVHAGAL